MLAIKNKKNLQGTTDVGRGDLLDPIVVANLPSFPLSKSYTHAFHPCNINLVIRNAWRLGGATKDFWNFVEVLGDLEIS